MVALVLFQALEIDGKFSEIDVDGKSLEIDHREREQNMTAGVMHER